MYKLPKLPYAYNALEPYIDAKTMEIHHTKHHQGYVDKLNKAIEGTYLSEMEIDIESLLRAFWNDNEDSKEILKSCGFDPKRFFKELTKGVKEAIRNQGGGHANHSLFWEIMSPKASEKIGQNFTDIISDKFGDLENLKKKFSEVALGHFGSGWAWLVRDEESGDLQIITTPNQDSPLMQNKKPLLGLDVWEHAYYLKYQNKRADYIEAFWKVVNWKKVEERFETV